MKITYKLIVLIVLSTDAFMLSLKNVNMYMIKRNRNNSIDNNSLYTTSLDDNEQKLPTKENSDNSEYSVNEDDKQFVQRLFNEASGGKYDNKTMDINYEYTTQLDDDETILNKLTSNESKDSNNQYTTSLDNVQLNITNNSINQNRLQNEQNSTNNIQDNKNVPENKANQTETTTKTNLQNNTNPMAKLEKESIITANPKKEKLNEFPSIPSPPPVPTDNNSEIISPPSQPSSTVTNINIEIDNPGKEPPKKEMTKNVLVDLIAELDKIIPKQTEKTTDNTHTISEIRSNGPPIQYYPIYIPVYYPQPNSPLPMTPYQTPQFYSPFQNTLSSLPQMPNQNSLNQPSPNYFQGASNYNQQINNNSVLQKQIQEIQNSLKEIHTNNKKNQKRSKSTSNSLNIINPGIIDEPNNDNFLNSQAYVVHTMDNQNQNQPQITNNQNDPLYNLV